VQRTFAGTGPPEFTAAARLLRARCLQARLEILDDFLAREDAEDPAGGMRPCSPIRAADRKPPWYALEGR
jgi:hypothetical protein